MVVKKKRKKKRGGKKKATASLSRNYAEQNCESRSDPSPVKSIKGRGISAGSPRDPVRRLEISTIWRGLFDFLPPSGGPLREERETSSAIKSHKRTADCSILVNTRMFQMFGGRVWRPIVREFFFENRRWFPSSWTFSPSVFVGCLRFKVREEECY